VTVDHYATAADGWAGGAELVYRPIARELIAMSPHSLAGRRVLDVGAGTGAASTALLDRGAQPIGIDLSHHMLAWDASHRPPATVGDVTRLPVRPQSVDDAVAAFVYNHLRDPLAGFAEARRVVRAGGAVLACTYSNRSHSGVRDALDDAARAEGWLPPDWYGEVKQHAAPLLGTEERRVAGAAGLVDVVVEERPVEVGVTTAQQLVDYRLGQAHFAPWLGQLRPDQAAALRSRLVAAITPIMAPYRPLVVFLAATVPPSY